MSLRRIVKTFWTIEREANEAVPKVYWGAADCHAEWVFQLKGGLEAYQSMPHYLLTPHSIPRHLTVQKELQLFGVRFYPDAFQQLFSKPVDEHINTIYHGRDLFQKDV
ncbi:MAG TPA: DUF6597 domain-containing transcriptional factor, partial [Flavisolibacter sp.]|nr:DUF6597 domain-containing transcriptional factor [Flavisolibacter sp.]